MIDPALALQGAIKTALSAGIATPVHDIVPPTAVLPYISFGPSQVNQQDADCFNGAEVFQQVDIWSREPGYTECKRIGQLVRDAIHNLAASHGGLTFDIEHQFTNYMRDGDGLTSHGVLSFRAEIYQHDD